MDSQKIAQTPPAPRIELIDDVEGHWASTAILALAVEGIVAGFHYDGSFRPDRPMTRAEFAALMYKALPQNKVQTARYFPDVSPHHWAYGAIQATTQMGFFKGRANGQFDPNAQISRLEVFQAITSGLPQWKNSRTGGLLAEALQSLPDASAPTLNGFSPNADAPWVSLDGTQVSVTRPKARATRGEIAALVYETLLILRTVDSSTPASA